MRKLGHSVCEHLLLYARKPRPFVHTCTTSHIEGACCYVSASSILVQDAASLQCEPPQSLMCVSHMCQLHLHVSVELFNAKCSAVPDNFSMQGFEASAMVLPVTSEEHSHICSNFALHAAVRACAFYLFGCLHSLNLSSALRLDVLLPQLQHRCLSSQLLQLLVCSPPIVDCNVQLRCTLLQAHCQLLHLQTKSVYVLHQLPVGTRRK